MAEEFLTEAFKTLMSHRKAEDALQEAFYRLWKKKFSPGSLKEAVAVLQVTKRNIQTDEFRRRSRHRELPLDNVSLEDDSGGSIEREAMFRRLEESVNNDLSPLQQRIVRLHEYEGKTFEDIAVILGMQPAAVRMQISRARKLIREKFRSQDEKY